MLTPHPDAKELRLLFVFTELTDGGEEADACLLARSLPSDQYRLDAIVCHRQTGVSDDAHERLSAAGIKVDTTPCDLSEEDRAAYLSRRLTHHDLVVFCQGNVDVRSALERLALRPPLIEHGRLASDAASGPGEMTARFVGISDTIRQAAASKMPGREHHALVIPPMVDLAEHRPDARYSMRAALDLAPDHILIGWIGRLDAEGLAKDVIDAAALIAAQESLARFLVVGDPDAATPQLAPDLRSRATALGLDGVVTFVGAHPNVPDLLAATDICVDLSSDGSGSHVILKAGAAGLPIVAASVDDASHPIRDGVSGLLVPQDDPTAVADAVLRLIRDPILQARLGQTLRAEIEATHAATVVVPQWQRLFEDVIAEIAPAPPRSHFASTILGGWECSTQRRGDGRRLDVIAAIGHDDHAEADYHQLGAMGVRAMRDGLRWHLIEPSPGRYDFRSWTPMLRAASRTGTQVIWDLLHYGWPDGIDIFSPAFVDRFRAFARAAARHRRELSSEAPYWCPVNEISFMSWGAGDVGYLNPFVRGRGFELKCQLARASIAAMEEARIVDPRARFVHCEPLIAIHHDPATGRPRDEAEGWHDAQWQALDLVTGRLWPQLGGREDYLDVVGLNYYFNNQWVHDGPKIDMDDSRYSPLSDLLVAAHARYGRPLLIAETGVEGDRRASWFAYVASEVERARARGAPVEGICLYPVANHPGWDDDRDCENGLLGPTRGLVGRSVHAPLADEVARVVAATQGQSVRQQGSEDDRDAFRSRDGVAA